MEAKPEFAECELDPSSLVSPQSPGVEQQDSRQKGEIMVREEEEGAGGRDSSAGHVTRRSVNRLCMTAM